MSKAAFLEELTALTIKYGILIGSCGCCGSPYLQKIGGVSEGSHYITDDDGDELTLVDAAGEEITFDIFRDPPK